jgi:hypothetical protein
MTGDVAAGTSRRVVNPSALGFAESGLDHDIGRWRLVEMADGIDADSVVASGARSLMPPLAVAPLAIRALGTVRRRIMT